MKIFLVLVLILPIFFACDNKSTEKKVSESEINIKESVTSNSKSELMSKKVNEIFDHANLNLQMSFIEKKFSLTAMSKTDETSTYTVDNCLIEFELTKKDNIKAISVFPSEKCFLEFEDEFVGKQNSNTIKIDKLLSVGKKEPSYGNLEVICPSSCGRTRETEYVVKFFGPTVTGSLRTSYTFTGPDGNFDWLEKVRENLKLDNLDGDLTFKGTDKNFILATEMFKNAYLTKATIF